uniref:Putative RNA-dependent RNA polymerase n=1 Tax=Rhizoctonia solani mitovirus 37 TaxID=2599426 RepID=A0A5B8GX06_9VIRU|nr:putative RNA-dependent RNA polymerase [Rhizoctonia solani mitovirus 37]
MKNNSNFRKIQNAILYRNRISGGGLVTISKVNATFSRNAKGLLARAFLRIATAIGLRHSAFRFKVIIFFIVRCKHLWNTQGMKGLVIHLKAVSVLFQQSLGEYVLKDPSPLKARPARTGTGLPKIIHAVDRGRIRAGDTRIMRFYMSLFALYRVLEFPGTLNLSTITDGFKGSTEYSGLYAHLLKLTPVFARMLEKVAQKNKVTPLSERGIVPRPIVKSAPGSAGPTVSTNPLVLATNAVNLKALGLNAQIEFFMNFYKGTKIPYPGLPAIWAGAANLPLNLLPSFEHLVGRLGFKDEAAGKVRVFAMVDAWTQWVLEPLHLYMFDILSHISMDGTFDQMKPVRAKAPTATAAYSLDLTAATDRIPMELQERLVAHLVNPEFAANWKTLLVGRKYVAFSPKRGVSAELTYGVGQPMGALSSWSSLAITHHYMVQVSSWLAGVTPVGQWFTDYAVLGDDLVIFNQRVKVHYLKVVAAMGVQCGAHKSLLSPRGVAIEFAKRTLYKGIDISPISLTEFVAANLTLADAIAFARKYDMTFPQLVKFLGYGYKVRGSLWKHIGSLNSRIRALMFAYYVPETEQGLAENLAKGNSPVSEAQIVLVVKTLREIIVEKYLPKVQARFKNYPSTAEVVKDVVSKAYNIIVERFNIKSLLITYVDKALPGQAFPPATEVAPSAYNPLTGTYYRPGFGIDVEEHKDIKEIEVSPAVMDALSSQLRGLTLVLERLTKLVVTEPMAKFRTAGMKLPYTVNDIRYRRTLFSVWRMVVEALKAFSNAGTGEVLFERVQQEPTRFASDPMQMRFWRDYTSAILMVLKRTKGNNNSPNPTPKEPNK